jgi:GT2 family glycosyltransferase
MGEICAVANNDVRVSKNWIDVANDILREPTVGSVHFRMIPYEQPFSSGKQTWLSGKEKWCSSSFFVVRAEQLYDEHFFNSYDDWDFWYRFRKDLKYITAYTNEAEYQHLDSSTVNRMEQMPERNNENREYFRKKHGNYPETLWLEMYPDQMNQPWKPFE